MFVLFRRSDDSSDTEKYLMRSGSDQLYLDDADAMFKLNSKKKVRSSALTAYTSNIEIADEALNENMVDSETPTTVSGKDSIVSGWKRKDNVSIFDFANCSVIKLLTYKEACKSQLPLPSNFYLVCF